ncbi:UDP-N-acetylmuramate dehydrogenase [Neobacillus jeddahensis]|uniref:UDP-N-acetylmuramate dehydrogenase n=1 Tax=Neobacillus jeddahensis TaxID=1461580 RepID=UPI0005913DAB|nr:UDP-N-acetylmuramate dehydrogenase [Neobacillus jeddahensis]
MVNHTFMNSLLKHFPSLDIKTAEPLKNHTYTKLGGPAELFAAPVTVQELTALLHAAKESEIPITIIGKGTNLIVKDGGIRGITISLKNMTAIRTEQQTIYAQAGAGLIEVTHEALQQELTGIEFACGIPGTVGGALYMNAGAYGGQISNVLSKALVMDKEGTLLTLSKEELQLGYRKSLIASDHYIVVEAVFELQPSNHASIKEKMHEFTAARERMQPLEYPSCGSVFKRPPGYYAGKLIQDCGLQGTRIGGAEVSRKHAGFIVNVDQATAQDYADLITLIQEKVKQGYGVELETEVILLGEDV